MRPWKVEVDLHDSLFLHVLFVDFDLPRFDRIPLPVPDHDGICPGIRGGSSSFEIVDPDGVEVIDFNAMREEGLLHGIPGEIEVPDPKILDIPCIQSGNVV